MDSAEENTGKAQNMKTRSFFHKNRRFYGISHPFPAAAKNSFPKYSTKHPEIKKHKISAQNRKTAGQTQISGTETSKNRHFSDEKPLFHKINIPYYCYY